MSIHPMLNIAIQAARNASRIILRYIDRLDSITVTEKSRNDLVTEVDRYSEEEIVSTIEKSYPDHSILAEESGLKKRNKFCWVIDPIDGTTNYVHGIPHYAISIAMKNADKLEIAVIYDPIRDELFTASAGGGARLNNRRIRVSNVIKLESALIGTGFPFREMQNFDDYLKIFSTILPKAAGIRRAGSAALDLAYVASGRFDGFWESGLGEWDMAAGALIIKEAGGMVSDYKAGSDYLINGDIIAGNPKIFSALLELIKPHKSSYDSSSEP